MFNKFKIVVIIISLFSSVNTFAANPAQPFLPSDNIQDPGCTPADSNCYVAMGVPSFSENVTGLNYSTSTGILSLTSGYIIPTVASTTVWDNLVASTTNSIQQNGNDFGATLVLGTDDFQSLNFETNNVSRLTVDAAGNVGIGTTTPGSLLTVDGNALIAGTLSANVLNVADGTSTRANLGLVFATDGDFTATQITAWGDSLTAGSGGTPYTTQLASLSGYTVTNKGVGGQGSGQIAVRQGGMTTQMTVTGGQIPTSGGVDVTFTPGYEPVTSQGPAGGVYGTAAGVYGLVTYTASSTYLFTRSATGTAVAVPISATFTSDVGTLNSSAVIIWAGRNNYANAAQVKSDIAAMVASLGHTRYIVLSVLNADISNEYVNQGNWANITQLNADLAATYGSHFLDVRSYLVSQYDPNNAQDVIDHANDIPPSSLRSDYVHLNTAGYAKVAQFIYANMGLLKPSSKSLVTPDNLRSIFASPLPIGVTAPNSAFFTQIGIATTSVAANAKLTISTANSANVNDGILINRGSNASGVGLKLLSSSAGTYRSSLTTMSNGTETEVITFGNGGSSNVGIGTTTPGLKLSVVSSLTNVAEFVTSSSSAKIRFQAGAGAYAYIGTPSSSGGLSVFANDGTTQLLSIQQAGNVGVGTTTPGSKLDVWGNFNVGTSSASALFVNTATGYVGIGTSAPNSLVYAKSVNPVLTLSDNRSTTFSIGDQLSSIEFSSDDTSGSLQGLARAKIAVLQADTFGGVQDMVFSSVNAAATMTEQMRIMYNGRVGIGTSSPSSKLTLSILNSANVNDGLVINHGPASGLGLKQISTSGGIYRNALTSLSGGTENEIITFGNNGSTNVGIGTASTSVTDKLQVFGDIRVGTGSTTGCIKDFSGTGIMGTCSSDERLKTNIADFSDGTLDKVLKLRAVSYHWNDLAKSLTGVNTEVTNYGLIAQNVEENFPELVTTDSNGYKQVNYSRVQLYILKALQELAQKVFAFKDEFHTNKLCVGDTCINEQQLKQLLQNQNMTGSQPSAPVTAIPSIPETASSTTVVTDSATPVEPITDYAPEATPTAPIE